MSENNTSAHALLGVLSANSVDRIFIVPGESYLGVLDALLDFPNIDTVVCRHEGGAGFMAVAAARAAKRISVVMTSRGPGASNAAIAIHTAQQDAVPLIMLVGQVPKKNLRRGAFQEIDYQMMYGSIAKWVYEVTDPKEMAAATLKAIRIATSGTPGPVVLVIPEDIQQQLVTQPQWKALEQIPGHPSSELVEKVASQIKNAKKPLIIAGGSYESKAGREALRRLAESWQIPVAVSFRRHDIFPTTHDLFVGELGLANAPHQINAFNQSDFILALGTRLGDITTQGYTFPASPIPEQTLLHCYPDEQVIGANFNTQYGMVCNPIALANKLAERAPDKDEKSSLWVKSLRDIYQQSAAWPTPPHANDGVAFWKVVKSVAEHAAKDAIICLDAGTFAAPVYRNFPFHPSQRLVAPLSGAMGYGVPAAIACALNHPGRQVICMVGDGGFLMNGNEIITAVERDLPILFILSNNNCYGSIRINQELEHPGRISGTTLFNPDFSAMAKAFGVQATVVQSEDEINEAICTGLKQKRPAFIEVKSSLDIELHGNFHS